MPTTTQSQEVVLLLLLLACIRMFLCAFILDFCEFSWHALWNVRYLHMTTIWVKATETKNISYD